jgi:hypothetical protein
MRPADPGDRLLQRGAHGGVQLLQLGAQRIGRHPDSSWPHLVEPFGEVQHRRHTAVAHGIDHRSHLVGYRVNVDLGPRQHGAQRRWARKTTTQVGAPKHASSFLSERRLPG